MRRLLPALLLVVLLGASIPAGAEPAGGLSIGREPTSPAGYSDDTSSASLPEWLMHHARSFRGNPVPLGVLTGAILLVALGFGIYTIAAAYRRPDASRHP